METTRIGRASLNNACSFAPEQGEERREELSERDFDRFRQLVYATCGIKLPPPKKSMLEARLRKRMRRLGIDSFGDYADFVFSPEGMERELSSLVDEVTTNKTDFFREPAHFEFLQTKALPQLMEDRGIGLRRPLRVWSAGCSTGEEPYTLAMVLSETAEAIPEFRFSILATDISSRVLEKACLGIYDEGKVDPVPLRFRKKYLLRSRDPERCQVRIVPELRPRVTFARLNLMAEEYGIRELMDVIFCRNVIIYFDRPTQEQLLHRFCRQLAAGGFIFMGHSETLNGMGLPLAQVAPSVYQKL